MNIVSFPGLNFEFVLNKVAFSILGVNIYWYAILITFSIIIGLIFAKKNDGMYNIKFQDIIDYILIAIPISILFARLYYVIFNLDNYKDNLWNILNIRKGGIAIYGCIFGGAIVIIFYSKIKKINVLDLLDYIIPYVSLGQAIGRWGNFINVEAYGTEYRGILRMGIIESNQYIEVHPTFLYESIITFILFFMLMYFQKNRKFKGEIFNIYLIIYSFFRMFIEELRVDSLMLGNIRISQLISIFIFIIAISIFVFNYYKMKYIEGKSCYEKN